LHRFGRLSATIRALDRERPGSVQALAVMVSGGPLIGAAEARRRTRYSVLSGLMLEGFLPIDPEHIGYLDLGPLYSPPDYAPFEWLYRPGDAKGREGLLLLWIDEDGLRQIPKESGQAAPRRSH
jgi:hypothetical protein